MNYSGLIYSDIANGLGVRTSIFVSGCRHHCKGCFNPETWDFNNGREFTRDVIDNIFNKMDDNHDGITLLGGDPLEPENIKVLIPFLKEFKERFPNKNIWCYTGYKYEDLDKNNLQYIDILVDGEFVEELKDIRLKFRGSSNQRIIDAQKSIKNNTIEELKL